MYRAINSKYGEIEEKIGKKGVLLARRDNSKFIRDVYEGVISRIADSVNRDDILYWVVQEINNMFSGNKPSSDFIVTKAVGNSGGLIAEAFVNEKGITKAKLGDYNVPILSKDETIRNNQLKKKGAINPKEYYLLCLPAQVQLAERMRNRGQRVDNGTRLEYLITSPEKHSAKQYEKIECVEYFKKHNDIIKIDYYYYLKALSNPLDQMLKVAFPEVGDFILEQYKYRYKYHYKLMEELKNLFNPTLKFID